MRKTAYAEQAVTLELIEGAGKQNAIGFAAITAYDTAMRYVEQEGRNVTGVRVLAYLETEEGA